MRKIFIDCPEEIPCNPCQFSCPAGAILIRGALTARPETLPERCFACGSCVAACPGQACFLVDEDYSDTRATIDFPYEFLPLPQPGQVVEARDNGGNTVCMGEIIAVLERAAWQQTRVVRMAVPKQHVLAVRGMKMPEE